MTGSAEQWRSQLPLLVGLLVAGCLLAVVWRLLDPYSVRLGDDNETSAAVDSTLGLLGVVAGLGTGVVVLVWPGSAGATRAAAAIIGSVLGAVLSWQVGDLIGTPSLRAVGAAAMWPLTTALVLFCGALLPGTSHRLLLPYGQFPGGQFPGGSQFPGGGQFPGGQYSGDQFPGGRVPEAQVPASEGPAGRAQA